MHRLHIGHTLRNRRVYFPDILRDLLPRRAAVRPSDFGKKYFLPLSLVVENHLIDIVVCLHEKIGVKIGGIGMPGDAVEIIVRVRRGVVSARDIVVYHLQVIFVESAAQPRGFGHAAENGLFIGRDRLYRLRDVIQLVGKHVCHLRHRHIRLFPFPVFLVNIFAFIVGFVPDLPIIHFGKFSGEICPHDLQVGNPFGIIASVRPIAEGDRRAVIAVFRKAPRVHTDDLDAVFIQLGENRVHFFARLFIHRLGREHQIVGAHPDARALHAHIVHELRYFHIVAVPVCDHFLVCNIANAVQIALIGKIFLLVRAGGKSRSRKEQCQYARQNIHRLFHFIFPFPFDNNPSDPTPPAFF